MSKIIAVDFDGTLCFSRFPALGPANVPAIQKLIAARRAGDRIVLWSSRTGTALDAAVEFCRNYGLEFDAVNENLPDVVARWGESRKVYADEYWDDKAAAYEEPSCDNCPNRREKNASRKSIYSWCANTCKNYRSKV